MNHADGPVHTTNRPPSAVRLRSLALASLLALGACGSGTMPTLATAPDTSPAVPTAVQVLSVTSDGLAGLFPFEGTSSSYTRADMRRDESAVKGTGTVSRFILSSNATATITRLDRRLVYTLDIPRAEYTECPLGGCVKPAAPSEPAREPQQPRSSRESDCTMKVANNTFNVKPTSQRKAINGFDTEQYAVDWSVVFEDPTKRRSTLQVKIDVWTTAPTPAMREAIAMEAGYARAAATGTDRSAVLPAEFTTMVNRYFATSLSAADRASLFNLSRQMERIKGQPILTELKLYFRGNACGGAAEDGAAGAGGPAGIAGALTGLFGGGNRSGNAGSGDAERPLLSFANEVKSWRVEPVRDSQFNPPPQFKRTNPR